MDLILQSAFLKALGWSLLDSLWQMGAVWLLYFFVSRNGKGLSSNQRHNIAFLCLGAGTAGFVLSVLFRLALPGSNGLLSISPLFVSDSLRNGLSSLIPYVSVVYLLVTVILLIRLYFQYAAASSLSKTELKKPRVEIRLFTSQMAGRMGISKEVRIFLSSLVQTPMTIGFWKPVILLPVALVNHLSLHQTESIILHELYHIQRNDFVMNLLIAITDIVLFFNPFARLLKDAICEEREHRCDDMVLQFRYDAASYAEALLVLEKQRLWKGSVALAATGPNKHLLLNRVKRLLTGQNSKTPVSRRLLSFFVVSMLLALLVWLPAKKDIAEAITTSTQFFKTVDPGEVTTTIENPFIFAVPAGSSPRTDAVDIAAAGTTGSQPAPAPSDKYDDLSKVEKELAKALVTDKVGEVLEVLLERPSAEFVAANIAHSFSFEPGLPAAPPEPVQPLAPYVPSNSFDYHLPQEETMLKQELEAMLITEQIRQQSIEELEEFPWDHMADKLMMEGQDLNLPKLEGELQQALNEVNWQEIQARLAESKLAADKQLAILRKQAIEYKLSLETKLRASAHLKSRSVQNAPMMKTRQGTNYQQSTTDRQGNIYKQGTGNKKGVIIQKATRKFKTARKIVNI